MNLRDLAGPVFFVLCLAVAGLIVAMRGTPKAAPLQGFTLYITQTAYPSDRAPFVSAIKVRQTKADGSWKLTTTYSNGRVDVGYGQPGRGVFAVDEKNQKLEYLSAASSRPLADIDWRKEPTFVGEETILGYQTYHLHREGEHGEYTDSYMCPTLQGFPLRSISGNARSKTAWEVTQVVLGEPSFEAAPNLPVSTERYEQKTRQ